MNYKKLKNSMIRMSFTDLKSLLGESIYQSLIEWSSDRNPTFTKSKLVEMIISVHGLNILKIQRFRSQLLKTLSAKEIDSIITILFGSRAEDDTDRFRFIEKISTSPWKDNKVSKEIAKLFDLPQSVFDMRPEKEAVIAVQSLGEDYYELLDYQSVIKNQILYQLTNGVELNRMLVQMPTGTGKTKTTVHAMIHHYIFNMRRSGTVIWVAHSVELLEQAISTTFNVWSHLGRDQVNCFRLFGNNKVEITERTNGFVFCSIGKLMSLSSNDHDLFNRLRLNTQLIIFDEAHKAAAPETRVVIESLMRREQGVVDRSLIGLTATPGRTTINSVSNDMLASMFGNRRIEINTKLVNLTKMPRIEAENRRDPDDVILYFQNEGVLSKIVKESLNYNREFTPSELSRIRTKTYASGFSDFTESSLKLISDNANRNQAIIRRLRVLNQERVPTILFACSVSHAQQISAMLSIEDIPNSLVIGDMNLQDREDAIRRFKDRSDNTNIIINYEVLTTGFDSTNIRCVFITRPTQSIVLYSQMLGRGLRGPKMGGNSECLLIDIQDNLRAYNENLAYKHFEGYWRG